MTFTRTWLAAILCAASVTTAAAADYPVKPITLVVPFAAGGSNDIVARAIGKKLSAAWAQPVVIDNRAGAGGVIGAASVATAPPDGHTLLLVSTTFTINAAVKAKLPFDTVASFVPVAFVGRSPLLLAASRSLPANTVADLIALARASPGKITYGSSGPGSINQIAIELLALSTGIKLVHVPYKGGSFAINDLIGGHVDLYLSSMPQILPNVRAGQAKALGVTSLQRSPAVPDVPTLDEMGVKGYEAGSWWGIVAPAGTAPDIVAALNREINAALATDEMSRFFAQEGAEPVALAPEAFATMIRAEIQRWDKVAREANIRVD
jgi:tripartite-type tricarboxylate transporter receptor subunit TctC